ncbi:MAG: carboxypeptidase regulatory-like domain-containing protein, partial [Planctomycetes bacterium]|nr:carboxypeptidase regulatory-like domain-containing protein [Planctomycetota bacterium]
AANTIPSLFFAQPANILGQMQGARWEDEDAIDGRRCYVIAGELANMTMKFWVAKDSLLILQRQQILGGKLDVPELSDEDIRKSLQLTGREAIDEAIEQFKEQMKRSRMMAAKMKGTITETHRNISIDQPVDLKPLISKYADIETVDPAAWLRELKADPDTPKPPVLTCDPQPDPDGEDMQVLEGIETDSGEISGSVVDRQGRAIEGVRVDVWHWYRGNETHTDENGFFRLDGFEPDQKTVEITFSKDKYTPRFILKQPVGLTDTRVVLDDRTYFEGQVLDPDSKPVAGAAIRALAGPKHAEGVMLSEIPTETTSNDDGSYRLYVQADVYDIQVTSGQGVIRLPKIGISKNEAKQLDLKLGESITFRAKVIDKQTGEPVKGFQLARRGKRRTIGRSDADGLIEITGMLPGKIEFMVKTKECGRWWSEQSVSKWARYSVREDGWQRNFDGLDFDLAFGMGPVTIFTEKPVRITGRVLDPYGSAVAGATAS